MFDFPEESPCEALSEAYLVTPAWFKPIESVIYSPIMWLRVNVGRPEDQCVYMLASLVSLISCFALKAHPGTAFERKLFSTLAGFAIHFYVFGKSGLASLVTNVLSYVALRLTPAYYAHIIIFIVSGFGLATAQIHKQVYHHGVNGLDVPMNLMFNFCRVTSLACCIRDGYRVQQTSKGATPDLKRREIVYAIDRVPNFFDFMSYLYFCGAAISGPFYEFKDFEQMMAREGDFANVPSTLKPGLLRFVHAWLCVATGAVLSAFVDENFMLTEEFLMGYSLPHKFFYQYLVLKLVMQTYLVGWCLMECGPIASGLSYNGRDEKTGEAKHDRV